MKPKLKILIAIVITGYIARAFTFQVLATNNITSIGISPPRFNIITDAGKSITENIQLYNGSDQDELIHASIQDFETKDELGNLTLEPPMQKNNFSIASWTNINTSYITVKRSSSTNVSFTINVPQNASPGAHYGAITFTTVPNTNNTLAITSTTVGSIIYIQVNGVYTSSIHLKSFNIPNIFWTGNIDITQRIANLGNIKESPNGNISFYNMLGNNQASIAIENVNILPGSTRLTNEKLPSDSFFGLYRARSRIKYGNNYTNSIDSLTTFWVLPIQKIIPITLAVIAVIFSTIHITKRIRVGK